MNHLLRLLFLTLMLVLSSASNSFAITEPYDISEADLADILPSIVGLKMSFSEFQSQVVKTNAFCGGAILSRQLILTAAHCVNMANKRRDYLIVFTGPSYKEKTFSASGKNFFYHPKYNSKESPKMQTNLAYDLVIVKLDKLLPDSAVPVRLAHHQLKSKLSKVAGYGTAKFDSESLDMPNWGVLHGTYLEFAEFSADSNALILTKKNQPAETAEEKVNNKSGQSNNRTGICNGDSGAPLFDMASGEVFALARQVETNYSPELRIESRSKSTEAFLSRHHEIDLCKGRAKVLDLLPFAAWIEDVVAKNPIELK